MSFNSISYNLDDLLSDLDANMESSSVDTTPSTLPTFPDAGDGSGVNLEKGGPNGTTPLLTFQLIVCCVGIVGNLLVIFVVLTLGEYKKAVTHWYVLQLAIADTLFLLIIPFNVAAGIRGTWSFASWMCRAKETILYLNYYASITFLMVMSFDRYIAVCRGFSAFLQKLRRPFSAYVTTATIWIISVLICIPEMIYSGFVGTQENCVCVLDFAKNISNKCSDLAAPSTSSINFDNMNFNYDDYFNYDENDDTISSIIVDDNFEVGCHFGNDAAAFGPFIYFNFLAMFIFPFMVMTVCYTLIVLRLRRSRLRSSSNQDISSTNQTSGTDSKNQQKKGSKSAATRRDDRNRNRVTAMCASLVLLFLICWLPFHAVQLAKLGGMNATTNFCESLLNVTRSLAYINSALNPFLYNFIGTRFGQRIRSASSVIRRSVTRGTSFKAVKYDTRKRRSTDAGSSSQATSGKCSTKIAFIKRKSEGAVSADTSAINSRYLEEDEQRLTESYYPKPDGVQGPPCEE